MSSPARDHRVMARYFTADLHLGHRNIIGYSERPFHDVGHMSGELIGRWNSTVGPTDEVIVLGDFGEVFAVGDVQELELLRNPPQVLLCSEREQWNRAKELDLCLHRRRRHHHSGSVRVA
jgi:hypothetical protein